MKKYFLLMLLFPLCYSCNSPEEGEENEIGIVKTDEELAIDKETITSEYNEGTELIIEENEFGSLFLELENNLSVGNESLNELWKDQRELWVNACQNSPTISELRELLIELESMVAWVVLSESWKTERENWIIATRAIGSKKELSNQLLIFEEMIQWDDFNPTWQDKKAVWEAKCLVF